MNLSMKEFQVEYIQNLLYTDENGAVPNLILNYKYDVDHNILVQMIHNEDGELKYFYQLFKRGKWLKQIVSDIKLSHITLTLIHAAFLEKMNGK